MKRKNVMVVLLTGANGFIGRHLTAALLARGHRVLCAVRNPQRFADRAEPQLQYVVCDFTRDREDDWLPRLAGVDVAINAAGIVRERGEQSFEAIHARGPSALFAACARSGIRLALQVSALGADEHAVTPFHLTKKAADDFLAALPLPSVIVQPSLIAGEGGVSARMFSTMAVLPLIPVPGGGRQQVQPVHIDDAVAAIVALAEQHGAAGTRRVALVGPEPLALRDFLQSLRRAMDLPPGRFVALPMPLVRLAARAGRVLPGSLLNRDNLRMLEHGNTADPAAITALLGHAPRAAEDFIAPADRASARLRARLNWLQPLLRWSIALVWIVTGIVSLGLYPVEQSYALLARAGIPAGLAPLMLYGAAALDLAFGIGILALKRRRWLWLAQIGVILLYTAIISIKLPEFWLHPYGPLLKNLPMLAAIWLLYELEEPPSRHSRAGGNPL